MAACVMGNECSSENKFSLTKLYSYQDFETNKVWWKWSASLLDDALERLKYSALI
jgi:hypothetical protein